MRVIKELRRGKKKGIWRKEIARASIYINRRGKKIDRSSRGAVREKKGLKERGKEALRG